MIAPALLFLGSFFFLCKAFREPYKLVTKINNKYRHLPDREANYGYLKDLLKGKNYFRAGMNDGLIVEIKPKSPSVHVLTIYTVGQPNEKLAEERYPAIEEWFYSPNTLTRYEEYIERDERLKILKRDEFTFRVENGTLETLDYRDCVFDRPFPKEEYDKMLRHKLKRIDDDGIHYDTRVYLD